MRTKIKIFYGNIMLYVVICGMCGEKLHVHFRCIWGGRTYQIPSTMNARRGVGAFREQNIHRPYYSYSPRAFPCCRVPFLKRTLHALTYREPRSQESSSDAYPQTLRGTPDTTPGCFSECIVQRFLKRAFLLLSSSTMRKARLTLRERHSR